MTDLTNKIDKLIKEDINSIQEIVNKYGTVLVDLHKDKDIPYLAYIIDIAVKYLNQNHNDLSKDMKTWVVMVVENKFFNNLIDTENDITETIDEFIIFWNTEHMNYIENMISATEFDGDLGFVNLYIRKNI